MPNKLKYILLLLISFSAQVAVAQYTNGSGTNQNGGYQNQNTYPNQRNNNFGRDTVPRKALTGSEEIDTLRKMEERRQDSVIFTTKFIKITNEGLLKDSTQLSPLDTTLNDFENYSPLFQVRTPKISLSAAAGRAARSLLFEPPKTIGFDVGLHALDAYMLSPQDIQYYNARVPYTLLTLYTGGAAEQIFKMLHTQNIKPNWNMGFNLNFMGSRGYYSNNRVLSQNVSNLNAAIFSWYESKNKRYNMLANLVFNNLKSPETGGILNDSLYTSQRGSFDFSTEPVRLSKSYTNWGSADFYLKQFYYIGRIDTTVQKGKSAANILPTQRVSYTLNIGRRKYNFIQNELDTYGVFPDYYYSTNRSRDSLSVIRIQNEFNYSFYLRGKSKQFVKNEFKLDLGLMHELYTYNQFVSDTTLNEFGYKEVRPVSKQNETFQNITIKGKMSYRFSDRVNLEASVNQIALGRNFGDFLYDAKLLLAGGNKAGKIILNAYVQSSSPPLVATSWNSNHYIFNNTFNNTKTTSLSFNYINNPLALDFKAEYFLITDYLYYEAQPNGIDAHPVQLSTPINLLKVSVGKNLTFGNFHFDNFLVYEKTDYQNTLRVPEVYTYSSLYYNSFLFKVLRLTTGANVRFNTAYTAPSYAIGLGQFYNGPDVTFSSYPLATVFAKATLKNTNLFVMYDYANQNLFSKGYYTVNRYPQQEAQLKFGVSWIFYQ